MPPRDPGSPDLRRPAKSPLGETLLRLEQNLEDARRSECTAESQFEAWQDRWTEHREQISRRLELIDLQLEALVRGRQARPQLSVIAEEDSAST